MSGPVLLGVWTGELLYSVHQARMVAPRIPRRSSGSKISVGRPTRCMRSALTGRIQNRVSTLSEPRSVRVPRHGRLAGAARRRRQVPLTRWEARRWGEGGGDGGGHGGVAGRGHVHFGEELGMAAVSLGDDVKKDGENIWISRMPIDLV